MGVPKGARIVCALSALHASIRRSNPSHIVLELTTTASRSSPFWRISRNAHYHVRVKTEILIP
jgi:hypothetical protein